MTSLQLARKNLGLSEQNICYRWPPIRKSDVLPNMVAMRHPYALLDPDAAPLFIALSLFVLLGFLLHFRQEP